MIRHAFGLALVAGLSSVAGAQVVINELFENPPGSSTVDDAWEFIELYGRPGMSLNGYAIALLKGGADEDGNNIPGPLPAGWDAGDHVPEIDEAFFLDGLTLGANGLLVLHNNTSGGTSNIPALSDPQTTVARWKLRHIPNPNDPAAGRLRNDGSSTYVLVRRRPGHSLSGTGQSVYAPVYRWWKDEDPDVNFDSVVDYGTETIVPAVPAEAINPARMLEPYQMVDEIAWSNAGGKEYGRSSEQEISDTPGFNPDAVSRVAFYAVNPGAGTRFADGAPVPTRMADEEMIYGDVPFLAGATALFYNSSDNPVNSTAFAPAGFTQAKGPTDPAGPTYDGSCDPDAGACSPAPGPYRFRDINTRGYRLTPGRFNDVNSTSITGSNIVQFRFTPGDANFDGVVDLADLRLVCDARMTNAGLGAGLDDTTPTLGADGVTIVDAYDFQGRALQSLLVMTGLSQDDGPGGVNSDRVTTSDVNALRVQLGFGVAPDQNGDGLVNSADLAALLGSWNSDSPVADVNCDGFVNSADLALLLGSWSN